MTNPLDDLEAEKEKTAAKRNAQDLEEWQKWKQNQTPRATTTLMNRFKREQNAAFKKFRAPGVDARAFREDLNNKTLTALDNYDPNKGATLRTYVNQVLMRSHRFNAFNQNMAHIPERPAKLIGPIDTAVGQLRETLGREPTFSEIGRQAGLTTKQVRDVQRARVKDIGDSAYEGSSGDFGVSHRDETIRLLRPTLRSGDEQEVYDYLFGMNGKKKMTSTGAIATAMGKSAPQISRIRRKIERAYKKYR